jgi:magnesium transporter
MLRSVYLNDAGKLQTDLDQMAIAFARQAQGGILWVDLDGSSAEAESNAAKLLDKIFHFHPLAIDDALQESHVPKVDNWGEYLYIVLHTVAFDPRDGGHVDTFELDIFLGNNYLVTYHEQPVEIIDRVWSAVSRDPRELKAGVDHLLYRLADEVVASYMPVVDQLDAGIDQIEEEIFSRIQPDTLERLFGIKRSVLYLRRIIAPQREVLNRLARDDYELIDARDRVYFRDVYDHLVRQYEIMEGMVDLVSGTLDTYLSVVNNRMNEVMKTLTIITTLFMPLSFVAGFFGMNFFLPVVPISEWMERPVFVLVCVVMGLTPAIMFWWMRRRGWMSR